MATNSNFLRKSRFWAVAVPLITLSLYLWSKTCQVIRESQSRTQDGGWWIVKSFSAEKTSAPSFTEKQLYLALFGAIQEDITSLISSISIPIIDWPVALVLLSSIILGSLFIYVFYIKTYTQGNIKKDHNTEQTDEGIKKEHYTGRTRSQPNRASKNAKTATSIGHGTKKQPSYKSFGWGYRHYWRLMIGIMFLAFLMSIPWEFVRLYQTMVAEKVTQMTTGIPAECVPEQMSVTQSLKSWLRWNFSWSSDPCLRYHKALLVDPMWQVPPLMVITSALSHCLVYPIEVFFDRLGRSFRLFFSEIPTQWQPVMFLVSMVFLALFLIMAFGYRIRCPLLAIEPRRSLSKYLSTSTKQKLVEDLIANSPDSSANSVLDYSITSTQATEIASSLESQKF